MGRILKYDKQIWDVTTMSGSGGGKKPGFKEESPADPVTVLQCYVEYEGLNGGAADSKIVITSKEIIEGFATIPYSVDLYVWQVGNASITPGTSYELFTGVASLDDGNDYIRIGNYDVQDGSKMRFFGESFEVYVTNSGTAYSAGMVRIIPVGYIVTA